MPQQKKYTGSHKQTGYKGKLFHYFQLFHAWISSEKESERPRFYEKDSYPWNLRRVPKTVKIGSKTMPHPGRECAIFIVHGMGQQGWTDTSVMLRSDLENALDKIRKWQSIYSPDRKIENKDKIPPPFIYEGFWADYVQIENSFREDWSKFSELEHSFFKSLWEKRSYAVFRTFRWFIAQPIRLLLLPKTSPMARLVYLPLQFLFPIAFSIALIRWRKIFANVLADVRLYAHPVGMSEKAIVQRIDLRVGTEFLRLMGLDIDFRPITRTEDKVQASGEPFVFKRIVWVAHSLGTVVSYNVLSDLFHRAAEIEVSGDKIQKAGAKKFRRTLRRFVTLGSPLDKFAYLFPNALRPWPEQSRNRLLENTGDTIKLSPKGTKKEWWINYYDVLDPVSGALDSEMICGKVPPLNIHSRFRSSASIPGISHSSYFSDSKVLRFILSRTYGKKYLYYKEMKGTSAKMRSFYAAVGYLVWLLILYGIPTLIIIYHNEIWNLISNYLKSQG